MNRAAAELWAEPQVHCCSRGELALGDEGQMLTLRIDPAVDG